MKQHEFIWFIKQYSYDNIHMLDNGDTVVKIKSLLFIHRDGLLVIRFVDFNENYIIPDRKQLDLIMNIIKSSSNFIHKTYTYCKEHLMKQ